MTLTTATFSPVRGRGKGSLLGRFSCKGFLPRFLWGIYRFLSDR